MTLTISDVMKSRRTIHSFKATPLPPEEIIIAAIEHATWAPNHHLTEPWQFHLLGNETKEKI